MSEFDTIKKDLKDIPTWVWWVGAGVVAVMFVIKRLAGTSTAGTTGTTDSSTGTTGTTSTDTGTPSSASSGTDMTATNDLLSQILGNQQSLQSSLGTPNAVTGSTAVSSPVSSSAATIPAINIPSANSISSAVAAVEPAVIQMVDFSNTGVQNPTLNDIAAATNTTPAQALAAYSNGTLTYGNVKTADTGAGSIPTNYGAGAVNTVYDPISNSWIGKSQLVNNQMPEAAVGSYDYAAMVAYQKGLGPMPTPYKG